MIGKEYTPEFLAELAKTPHLRAMEMPATPKKQRITSFTKRYTDDWTCKTTFFDVDKTKLASVTVDCDASDARFGFTLDHDVEKVEMLMSNERHSLSFTVRRWFEECDESARASVVLAAESTVEIQSEVGVVCAIEERYTAADTTTSFFDDESDEPWLVIEESN